MISLDFSFASSRRLKEKADFARFFEGSKKISTRCCVIYFISNQHCFSRLGVTFKAKATSVQRNRIKRVIREAFRIRGTSLGCYDVNVVIPKGMQPDSRYSRDLAAVLNLSFNKIFGP